MPIRRILTRTRTPSPILSVLIFSIGAAFTNVFGSMVGQERQGWAMFTVVGILFLAGVFTVYATESGGNPAFASLPIDAARALSRPAATWRARRCGLVLMVR
jgi:K+-transporting ATPase A subunit